MIDKRIGFRMKEYREKLGMTQEAFAEKLECLRVTFLLLNAVLHFRDMRN